MATPPTDSSAQEAHRQAARDLQAVARGERAALERLYERFTPVVYAMLVKLLKNRSDAEEVVQETWVQVWKRASSYDPRRGSVAAWLVTLARNRALDGLRSASARKRRERKVAARDERGGPDPTRPARLSEVRNRVQSCLQELEPKRRQVIELAYWEGLTQRQIAERLAIPLGTVKTWTRQALGLLRRALPEGDL